MVDKVLDFRGKECPEPLIKTSKILSNIKKGDKATILTDIEDCVRLIKELIEISNVEDLSVEKTNGYWIIKVLM